MRIVQFVIGGLDPDSANGVQKTIHHLGECYARMGHQVANFAISRDPTPVGPGIHFAPSRFPWILPGELRQAILDWKPDVVHLHSSFTLETVVLAHWLRRHNIPYVETTHGNLSSYVAQDRWYLKVPFKHLLQLPYLNRSAFIHATDHERIARSYGVTAPIVTAHNAIEFESLPAQFSDEWFFNKFPQARGRRIFLFLGRLSIYQKGLDKMIEAFKMAGLPDWVLVLVGPGSAEDRSRLEQMVDQLKLQSQVILVGPAYKDDKWSCLAAADVFVHTSRWEGGAFTALESAAAGLPLLITPGADATGEFWHSSGVIGVHFDVADIARGMREFARRPQDEVRRMGQANREFVRHTFNWEVTARTISNAYMRFTGCFTSGYDPPDDVRSG